GHGGLTHRLGRGRGLCTLWRAAPDWLRQHRGLPLSTPALDQFGAVGGLLHRRLSTARRARRFPLAALAGPGPRCLLPQRLLPGDSLFRRCLARRLPGQQPIRAGGTPLQPARPQPRPPVQSAGLAGTSIPAHLPDPPALAFCASLGAWPYSSVARPALASSVFA